MTLLRQNVKAGTFQLQFLVLRLQLSVADVPEGSLVQLHVQDPDWSRQHLLTQLQVWPLHQLLSMCPAVIGNPCREPFYPSCTMSFVGCSEVPPYYMMLTMRIHVLMSPLPL